jgi:hypothetical protein
MTEIWRVICDMLALVRTFGQKIRLDAQRNREESTSVERLEEPDEQTLVPALVVKISNLSSAKFLWGKRERERDARKLKLGIAKWYASAKSRGRTFRAWRLWCSRRP